MIGAMHGSYEVRLMLPLPLTPTCCHSFFLSVHLPTASLILLLRDFVIVYLLANEGTTSPHEER